MTDKQIIIDGVDVSGCPHIEYEHKWWNMAGHEQNSENVCHLYFDKNADFEENFLCRDNLNCYYKQLKRKEQECERLKRQHQGDKGLITSTGKMNYQLLQEYDKLKTALTEIKEIAEILLPTTDEYDSCYYKDKCHKCEVQEDCQYFKVEQILQKISEVEDGI